ncbi:DMT family transporter [Paenibacillus paeoniae]|nr:multidrug efflux SMR transporter [Paenibacillus paeoniae]
MAYLLLGVSIVLEVFGSTMLKASNGFRKIAPTTGTLVGYFLSFYLVSIVLKTLPLGLVYATWSAAGTILTAVMGVLLFKESLNKKGVLGIAILIVGLVLLNAAK